VRTVIAAKLYAAATIDTQERLGGYSRRVHPCVRAAVVVSALAIAPSAASPADAADAELFAAVAESRFPAADALFAKLDHPTVLDQYLVGFADVHQNLPWKAEPHLTAVKEAGGAGPLGWTSVEALLARIETVKRLAPPTWAPAPAKGATDPAVAVRAGPATSWTAPVLDALPSFIDVGRRIFGDDLPPVAFHLFSDRPTFDRFYAALFGVPEATSWQDGTGGLNAVVFCAVDRTGRTTRPAGAPDTVGCVLHEFSHAWCGTYLMNRYGKEWLGPKLRTPWLDEGLADFVASLRDPGFLARRAALLGAKAKSVKTPSLDEMATYKGFYDADPDVHYWLSAVFVAQLLEPRGSAPTRIRALLDEIGRTGDVGSSIAAASGKDVRKTFAAVTSRFW
jgi:hypothetical protein